MNRDEIIRSLKENPEIDVLVIGAGINGAGTFRDLALNGVNVLLIDRGDFCSGASATSSHMAHGGIRYLENGEFRLVREAVTERNRMIENAPHLVQPLPTVIPIFKIFSGLLNAPLKFLNLLDRPSERGALVIKIGLIFYDSFTRKQKTVPKHRFFDKKRALNDYPYLNKDIKNAALYFDGQLLSPERMTVEIILDGENEGEHARAINYVTFKSFENGTASLIDITTGQRLTACPKIIINAAGPWVDTVNGILGINEKMVGGTKGSHLVINNKELRDAVGKSEFFFENKDGRIVLLLPFYDRVIVGTSDLPIENYDNARCTEEEESYFLDMIKRVFPTIPVSKDEIVFRFSGVRPLEYMKAKTTGQITRDHSLKIRHMNGKPIISMVGGKWTSYRAFSEQAADVVLDILGKGRIGSTASLPLGGGKGYPSNKESFISEMSKDSGLPKFYCATLLDRYGSKANQIINFIKTEGGKFLTSVDNWTDTEVKYIVEVEKPVHLDDIFLRRSTIGWVGKISSETINEFSRIIGKALKWTENERISEVERLKQLFVDFHGVQL